MSRVYIIMYHYVRNIRGSRYPGIKGLETGDFIRQLDCLRDNGFTFIRMEDLIAAYYEGAALPEKPVLLTFDDGYSDHFSNVFPILNERGIQGSFFVPGEVIDRKIVLPVNKIHFILASVKDHQALKTELLSLVGKYRGRGFDVPEDEGLLNRYEKPGKFDAPETAFIKRMLQSVLPEKLRDILCGELLEKYLGIPEEVLWEELYLKDYQLKTMKRCGMFIGAHGYHHYHLDSVPVSEMREDIIKGLDCLEGLVDRSSWVMNYPYGSFNEDVEKEIKALGAKLAITTKVGINDTKENDAYNISRLNTNDLPPVSSEIPVQ